MKPNVLGSAAYWYFAALSLAYVVVSVHTPLTVYPGLPHDDGLFMSLGRSFAEGRWLGRFSQFTLMKGPGYPVFLALANWLGISVTLAHAIFHCAAIALFVAVVHQFIRSTTISAVLFALLLWHPIALSAFLRRVLREDIYYGQTLVVVAGVAAVLFLPMFRRRRLVVAAVAGAFFGWFWLTREEGVWVLPAIGLMTLLFFFWGYRQKRLGDVTIALLVLVAVFATTQFAFRSVNRAVYGMFVGVDVKETNFLAALRAIHGVRSGGVKPFVSITREARARVYEVSPAFASLSSYFEGAPGQGWSAFNCQLIPVSCGDIGSGWFMWALRDAAAAQGHYSTPAAASAFFGKLADEINGACVRGALECAPQLIPEIAPVSWSQLFERVPSRYGSAFDMLLLRQPPIPVEPSGGPENLLAISLRFLNFPLHTRPADVVAAPSTYSLSGWYYKSGNEWLSITARAPNGSAVDVQVDRVAGPDIQAFFKDPAASNQRFTIRIRCIDECMLTFETLSGAKVEQPLAAFRRGAAADASPDRETDYQAALGFVFGGGNLHVDSMNVQPNPTYSRSPIERLCGRVREIILKNYSLVFIPILCLGAVAFLAATIWFARTAAANVCYILALASWLLVFTRASLLILIDATSFPTLNPFYLSSAYFFLVSAAILSCAAWLQLSGRVQSFSLRSDV